MARAPVFQKTYEDYLQQVGRLDLRSQQELLGYEMDGSDVRIALFDRTFNIREGGIFDSNGNIPDLPTAVVLSKYLLLCPSPPLFPRKLKTYKDFRDAAPLISYFDSTVQGKIARDFHGRAQALDRACQALGGRTCLQDLAYQIKYQFSGLPQVPVYLLYNDAEEGFAAQCTLLFEQRAQNYLDMESLAMLGGILAVRLEKADHLKPSGEC
jgi:hypothetical protein